jgi:hypothetical protein
MSIEMITKVAVLVLRNFVEPRAGGTEDAFRRSGLEGIKPFLLSDTYWMMNHCFTTLYTRKEERKEDNEYDLDDAESD